MTKERDGHEDLTSPGPAVAKDEDRSAREAKRLAARRRVLLGVAATAPMIVTFGRREALALDDYVCQSLGDVVIDLPGGAGTETCTCKFVGQGMDSANECKPENDP
ncbi:MAG: hypothetical protein R3245_12880 [Kiloniellales bacterium]|nr:hypothetical protein [Kiloniellales bacterium]